MSDELKELQHLNTNIQLLTQAFNNYVEKMDEKTLDHRDRITTIETTQNEHHDDIATLKFQEKARQGREALNTKLLYGAIASVIALAIRAFWNFIISVKLNP